MNCRRVQDGRRAKSYDISAAGAKTDNAANSRLANEQADRRTGRRTDGPASGWTVLSRAGAGERARWTAFDGRRGATIASGRESIVRGSSSGGAAAAAQNNKPESRRAGIGISWSLSGDAGERATSCRLATGSSRAGRVNGRLESPRTAPRRS